jgi:group I intron endonuclease
MYGSRLLKVVNFHAYTITCTVNNKKYVGISTNVSSRWDAHRWAAQRGSAYLLHRAIRLHGIENFNFEVIASARDWDSLCKLEVTLISQFAAFGSGYNMTAGGEGVMGRSHSAEWRAKMSALRLGVKRSPETCVKIGDGHRGKTVSTEARENMSTAHTGKKRTPESIAKQSSATKGRSKPAEWREKMKTIMTGKTHSAETKAKLSAKSSSWKRSPDHIAKMAEGKRVAKIRRASAGPLALAG